jgi:hypothetical protein
VAGYLATSATNGHMKNTLGELDRAGLIVKIDAAGESQRLQLTTEGRARAVAPTGVQTLAQLHDTWLTKVGKDGLGGRMLQALLRVYPAGMSRADLAAASGSNSGTGGHFKNTLGELKGKGIVEVDGTEVKATAVMFPGGLS